MIGRTDKLESLNQNFTSEKNNLTILYGRHGIGKTTLIKEFIKDKNYFYYEAAPGASFELLNLMRNAAGTNSVTYLDIFEKLYERGTNLFIIEEFHHLVKVDEQFINSIVAFLSEHSKVMIVLSCPSVSWIENSMVKSIGRAAFSINTFMKLKELNYSDMVSVFPDLDAATLLQIYGITGGIPLYISKWNSKKSVQENICDLFLDSNGNLYNETFNYVKDEFREIGVYNTILYCLASGKNKLNEIHEYTGYGRDKISVYLKNLIAREIVEKIFSYDIQGNENTRKGLYRIKDGFLAFWYGFIYPYRTALAITKPKDFYDKYINNTMQEFFQNAFIKIASEMLEIMNDMERLPLKVEKKGSWYGKNGNIHLIFEDEEGNAIVGQVYEKQSNVTEADLSLLKENVKLAGINSKYYFLFSLEGFESSISEDNITTVTINEL